MKKHSQQHASSRRLLILIGISLSLHGVLLIHWPTSKPVLEFDYQLQNLALNLEAIKVIGQQKQAQKKAVTTVKPQPATITTAVPDKPDQNPRPTTHRQTAQETSVTSKTTQDQQHQTASKVTTPSMNRARILSQIRHDLSQYFYYPPLARRKGMQGTVLLGFGISGHGAIRDIRVVKSSGYAILDLAAQDAMQRLEKLSWYAASMHGKDMDLELPIIFRLTEG
jgi:TonB family protein